MCIRDSGRAIRPMAPPPEIVIPRNDSGYNGSESSEDILCDAAMEMFARFRRPTVPCIKRHVLDIIKEEQSSPLIDHQRMSENLVRIRSGGFPIDGADSINYINQLVIKATQKALEEQQGLISIKDNKINNRLTRKRAAAICGILSSLSTTIVGLVIHYKGSCK
jgi:hypothetical protein